MDHWFQSSYNQTKITALIFHRNTENRNKNDKAIKLKLKAEKTEATVSENRVKTAQTQSSI